jgi:hypothetical protein
MPQRTACDCAGPYAIEVTSIQIDGFELLKFAPATNSQVPTAALRRPSAGVRAGPDGTAHAVSVPTRCRAPVGGPVEGRSADAAGPPARRGDRHGLGVHCAPGWVTSCQRLRAPVAAAVAGGGAPYRCTSARHATCSARMTPAASAPARAVAVGLAHEPGGVEFCPQSPHETNALPLACEKPGFPHRRRRRVGCVGAVRHGPHAVPGVPHGAQPSERRARRRAAGALCLAPVAAYRTNRLSAFRPALPCLPCGHAPSAMGPRRNWWVPRGLRALRTGAGYDSRGESAAADPYPVRLVRRRGPGEDSGACLQTAYHIRTAAWPGCVTASSDGKTQVQCVPCREDV